jgi:signal transduction histidine kinase
VENSAADLEVQVPVRTLVRSVKGLIKNGLEASRGETPVLLKCFHDKSYLYFEVTDHGGGMDEEQFNRSGDPFFTTKEQGLGLGLFLARNVAEQFDGELVITSVETRGTTIKLSLSLEHIGVS